MPGLGIGELAIILLIVMIFFGVGKLGEIGGALGSGIREFKSASREQEPQIIDAKSTDKTDEAEEAAADA